MGVGVVTALAFELPMPRCGTRGYQVRRSCRYPAALVFEPGTSGSGVGCLKADLHDRCGTGLSGR